MKAGRSLDSLRLKRINLGMVRYGGHPTCSLLERFKDGVALPPLDVPEFVFFTGASAELESSCGCLLMGVEERVWSVVEVRSGV